MDQNRPRTRGLEASEAEEDAKAIKAALKEPGKLNLKNIQQKLKRDYGGGKEASESDDEERLFYNQPPYDDDEDNDGKPGGKRRRYRRGVLKKRARCDGTIVEEEYRRPPARLAAILKEECKPNIEPYNKSMIEYKQIRFKIGDIVSVQKDETKYYAQLLGFHIDQFCEKYASIRWLLPNSNAPLMNGRINPEGPGPESFRTYVEEEMPINMNSCKFVLRPPSWYFNQGASIRVIPERSYYIYKNKIVFLDTPSPTLTSADRRY